MKRNVKIYSTPTCQYCKLAKKFLNDNNVQYEDVNVAADKAAREEMFKKSSQLSVPQIEIDGELIIGFDKISLKEKLGLE
ncbi:MAG: glutathione S-transferase N-terminal domain-containing protein [Dehalococcoidia bacterium]|nr:glutathione S-transferase N-terminal domain-containing protein [Dehalococcoidia bacterium]